MPRWLSFRVTCIPEEAVPLAEARGSRTCIAAYRSLCPSHPCTCYTMAPLYQRQQSSPGPRPIWGPARATIKAPKVTQAIGSISDDQVGEIEDARMPNTLLRESPPTPGKALCGGPPQTAAQEHAVPISPAPAAGQYSTRVSQDRGGCEPAVDGKHHPHLEPRGHGDFSDCRNSASSGAGQRL